MEFSEPHVADDTGPADRAVEDDLLGYVSSELATGRPQVSLAREIGVSGTTLSQWLRGKYRGDNDAVRSKVEAWRSNRTTGAAFRPAAGPGWISTPSGDAIRRALDFARSGPSIAAVYGGAGVGKTTAIRHYAQQDPNVWRVTVSPSSGSLLATLEEVAAVLELKGLPNRPSTVARAITTRIDGTRGLLVIDEAQHLSLQSLEEIRSIHDASGIGLVLCGNDQVYSKLTGGSRRATFAQLFSRIGHRLRLDSPTEGDVDAVLAAWQIEGSKEFEFSRQIANLPGGLRGLMNTLKSAALAAASAESPITASLMRQAWRSLGGEA